MPGLTHLKKNLCLVKTYHMTASFLPEWSSTQVEHLIFKWAIPGLFFFIFVFSIQLTVNVQYKILPMTGFEPQTTGIGSNCSTN